MRKNIFHKILSVFIVLVMMVTVIPTDVLAIGKENVIEENKDTGVLILTDLFGGSPFLNTCKLMRQYGQYMEVVTGYNLAMVLELASSIQTDTVEELKQKALEAATKGIIDVKERMK